jgi:ABC-type sugar transport system substrate-binding protein
MKNKLVVLISLFMILAIFLSACAAPAATQAPAAATEAPAVATEAPAVATEAPAVATEAPAVATEAPAKDPIAIAAETFSADVCDVADPAAVANIPAPVSGFSGYDGMEGDWLVEPATSPLAGKKVALTVMGLGQPFFLAIKGHWEHFAEKYGFELKVFDGKFDAGTVQANVEDIISWKPDAVAFAPLDSDASVAQVKKIQEAGITVITYNVQPREQIAPRVFADDFTGSRIVGCNAGKYYKAMFGDKPALIGVVDLPALPQVQDRKNGFYYGFLSVVPNAKIGQTVDGGGVIDKANPAATDLIQANPDMNVIFGINNDSSLGTLRALKAAGLYTVDWGVLASVDGSAPVMEELGNPETPYKAESGYPPYDFSIAPFILLGMAYEGKVDATSQVVLAYPAISPTADGISTWVNVQYPTR